MSIDERMVIVVSASRTLPTPEISISCSMRSRSVSPTFGLICRRTVCAWDGATEAMTAIETARRLTRVLMRYTPYGSSAGSPRNGVAATGVGVGWAGMIVRSRDAKKAFTSFGRACSVALRARMRSGSS
jgi:hypothetical protein